MDEIKLKPCPFCGSEARTFKSGSWGRDAFAARCTGLRCLVRPRTGDYFSRQDAAKAWNRRAR